MGWDCQNLYCHFRRAGLSYFILPFFAGGILSDCILPHFIGRRLSYFILHFSAGGILSDFILPFFAGRILSYLFSLVGFYPTVSYRISSARDYPTLSNCFSLGGLSNFILLFHRAGLSDFILPLLSGGIVRLYPTAFR